MRRFLALAAAILLAMLLLPGVPATAAPPLGVTITVDELAGGDPPGGEPFIADGPAVAAGLLCAAGNVEDLGFTVYPSGSNHIKLTADKRFSCGDGSGSFEARLWVKLYPDQTTTAKWKITGGDGAYGALRGWGTLVGTPFFDEGGEQLGITDVYTGKLKG